MRPLECDAALRVKFLEQVLNEQAHGIYSAVHGVQP